VPQAMAAAPPAPPLALTALAAAPLPAAGLLVDPALLTVPTVPAVTGCAGAAVSLPHALPKPTINDNANPKTRAFICRILASSRARIRAKCPANADCVLHVIASLGRRDKRPSGHSLTASAIVVGFPQGQFDRVPGQGWRGLWAAHGCGRLGRERSDQRDPETARVPSC
jgi:hypothetical protein